MDAQSQARGYLARHGVELWFRAAAERLVVSQPENPMHDLYEALGKEIETREKLKSSGREEKSVSLMARIVVRGRGGVRQEISLDKVANEDMLRGAQGALMMQEWGSLIKTKVSEALLGSRHGGDASNGAVTEAAGASSEEAADGENDGSSNGEGAEQALQQEGHGSGSEHWTLPEEMKIRLKQLFDKIDKDDNGVMDADERDEMREEMRMLLIEFGMGGNVFERLPVGINYAEFEAWFLREWETASKMQALADIDLARAMAELIPGGSVHHPLGGLERMGATEIRDVTREKLGAAAELALSRKQAQVKVQAERMRARQRLEGNEEEGGGGTANSKYAILGEGVRMAKFGSIEDFHTGIGAEIGMPNPNFMEGMEAEHCNRQDSKDEFKPGNYDTRTTPCQEWLVATDEDVAKRMSVGARRVRTIKDLMEDPLVKKAGLRDVEVVALVLYTGPMFLKYNGILRRFPDGVVKGLKGNTYTTTIYCIVSGIIKLSKFMRLPDSRMVYRGLGGLDLPKAFTTPDECGIRGGVENGMLSTTLDRKVALQYAGNTMPTVFEISLGAIDRGASLQFLSQYPDEGEILLPPRSYLEVIGGLSRKETDENGRVIKIVSLKVNSNMTSSTIEQIEGKRMEIFLSAGANALDNIKSKTKEMLESDRLKQYIVHHPLAWLLQEPAKLADSIVKEGETWLFKYREKGAGWFNDEWQYSTAMRELSELETLAVGKIDFFLGGGGCVEESMKGVARFAEADMIRRLNEMVAKSKVEGGTLHAEARELALELCRKRGAVIKSIDETNDFGEPPLVASGVRGDVENLSPLLIAGCKLDSASQGKLRRTALHMSCTMGHLEYVRRLADEGADLFQTTTDGRTGLVLAAHEGHLNVVKLMLERGGRDLGMKVDESGWSSALAAASQGHLSVLQYLNEVCGRELLMLVEFEGGASCAHTAASEGHIQVVKYLYEACGQELLMKKNGGGVSCAYGACLNGHLDILEYVHELCGTEMLMLVYKTGLTGNSCAHAAAMGGHLGIIEYLHKACGTELLMLLSEDGISCAQWAALKGHLDVLEYLRNACGKEILMIVGLGMDVDSCAISAVRGGHLNVVEYLHRVCGKELLMLVNQDGASCAHAAASNGHLDVMKFLNETCGKELLMLVNKDGSSCAHAAAAYGHLDVMKYLNETCGKVLLMLLDKTGASCALSASRTGHLHVVEYLHNLCGKELLMFVDQEEVSCAHVAAFNGHLQLFEFLHRVCGTELLMLVDKEGTSCALFAAGAGHLHVLEYIYKTCGKESLMLLDKNGRSCAQMAAANGHLGVVKYVHRAFGTELLMQMDMGGRSCAHDAAVDGHLHVLEYLHKVCGTELLMLLTEDGFSCAQMASKTGHLNVVEYLHNVCGKELLMQVNTDGISCALFAALGGHLDVVEYLHNVCGKELLMQVNKDDVSCGLAAAGAGHLHIVEYIHNVCGKELLMQVNKDGTSCALAAALGGHLNVVEYLHNVCGKELLMQVNDHGTSSALAAASVGHLNVVEYIHNVCGKELLMQVNKDGTSCALAALLGGHFNVVEYLHGACGTELLMPAPNHRNTLSEAIGNKDMCMLLARLGGLELLSVKDAIGWTFLHRLVYCGDDALACEIASISQGEVLLDMARREVAEYDAAEQGDSFVVHRGFPGEMIMDRAERTIIFFDGFTSMRSQNICPVGSRGYFELEIINMSKNPQFGFANADFPAIRGKAGNGVGDDSFSWSLDGARKRKFHGGLEEEWDCSWRDGDVIGLACDLVEGKLHVSLNGDFSAPNGSVFEIDVKECSGLFAAFSAGDGKVRYNLGEAAFKHSAPSGSEYTAFNNFLHAPLRL